MQLLGDVPSARRTAVRVSSADGRPVTAKRAAETMKQAGCVAVSKALQVAGGVTLVGSTLEGGPDCCADGLDAAE